MALYLEQRRTPQHGRCIWDKSLFIVSPLQEQILKLDSLTYGAFAAFNDCCKMCNLRVLFLLTAALKKATNTHLNVFRNTK
jgi:hypothetical protein